MASTVRRRVSIKIESLEKKMLPNGKIYETPVYIYEIGNEGYVKVTPQYDTIANCTNDKIGEIFVYSDLFLTPAQLLSTG